MRLRRRPPAKKIEAPELARPAYADRHVGRTALVLGNGPSLHSHREPLLDLIHERDALVLGGNHITPFTHPHYHAFTNRKRFAEYASTFDPSRSRLLVGAYISDDLLRAHVRGPYERIPYVNDHEARFDVVDGVIQASCRTVGVLLIGVAIVMGAGEIFVAGLDGYAAGRTYHAETTVLKARAPSTYEREIEAYTERFLREIQQHLVARGRPGFAIVTPTTYDEHYRPDALR